MARMETDMYRNEQKDNNQKIVLFKASSPFTVFTAIFISTLYYHTDYKILLLEQFIYDGFDKKAIELGFFDEVILLVEADKSVVCVENVVKNFLNKYNRIDDYFMNTFSDCYSVMIAYLLKGKANLHIFPEGGTTVHLRETIDLILKNAEYVSKDEDRLSFFKKYPIDLDMFDYTWLYDMEIPQGLDNLVSKHINSQDFFERRDALDVLLKLNDLFKYENSTISDVYFMETFLPGTDYLDYEVEKQITDVLFELLIDRKIAIKPHPPNSSIPFTKSKYRQDNVCILENADVPWELIFLNAVINGKKELTIITLLLESTYVMTTIALMPSDFTLNLVILSEIEKQHMSSYLSVSHELNYDYFSSLLKRKGVNACVPQTINDMKYIREMVVHELCTVNINRCLPDSNYFRRVGNLLSKTIIYDAERNFIGISYFSFAQDYIEIVFDIDQMVSFDNLVWIPCEKKIFASASNINVKIYDNNGHLVTQESYDTARIAFNKGTVDLPIKYIGECSVIRITSKLEVFKRFVKIYGYYCDKVWRADFWERWYSVISENSILNNEKIKKMDIVWIYGNAKIARAIYKEIEKVGIRTIYVLSKNKKDYENSATLSINEALDVYGIPSIIIITAMNDYEYIMQNMPAVLRRVAIRLDNFLDMLL